jgi:hypothetical protein
MSSFYQKLKVEFQSSHKSPANVLVHFFTSFGFYASLISLVHIGLLKGLESDQLCEYLASSGIEEVLTLNLSLVSSYFEKIVGLQVDASDIAKVLLQAPNLALTLNAVIWASYYVSVLITVTSQAVSVVSGLVMIAAFLTSSILNLSLLSTGLLFATSYLLQVRFCLLLDLIVFIWLC